MIEEWRPIKDYEGLYEVSNLGRIRSFQRNKVHILKTVLQNSGYELVNLTNKGKHTHYLVHRLVAQAFLPNPNNFKEVNHKDEVKTNNCVSNLEWCTSSYNKNYGNRNSKMSKTVYQYSLDGQLISEYTSMYDVERKLGYCASCIGRCCVGKRKTAYGYVWTRTKKLTFFS